MEITVKQQQTIFDVALIAYQDASRVYDLIADNSQIDNINSDLTGMTLSYTPSVIVIKTRVAPNPKPKLVVTISDTQTLFDVALQYFGGAEFIYDLIKRNNVDNLTSDPTGIVLSYDVSNLYVPVFFRKNGFIVGTKYPVSTSGGLVIGKDFQDSISFEFMDDIVYSFQDQ